MFNKIKNWLFHEDLKKQNLAAFIMLAGSGLGLLASFILSIEALELAKNSHAVLSCDFSSALSCSAVANHWSAAILGFPNSKYHSDNSTSLRRLHKPPWKLCSRQQRHCNCHHNRQSHHADETIWKS